MLLYSFDFSVLWSVVNFVHLYVLFSYAMNIGFYLLLRARRLAVSAHPVVKRLLQYRQLLQQLEPLEKLVSNHLEDLLKADKDGKLSVVQENGPSKK